MTNEPANTRALGSNVWRIVGWGCAALLLLLPAVAMQFTNEVNWSASGFIVMGVLIGSVGLGIEFLVRKSGCLAYRLGAVTAMLTLFLTIWVNLAVGMIGDDHPYNLVFLGVLAVALIGAIAARFKPAGMARAMVATAAAQGLAGAGGLATDPIGAVLSICFAGPWLLAAVLFRKSAREVAIRPASRPQANMSASQPRTRR